MSAQHFLLSIDQGTTSSRAILFASDGRVAGVKQKELRLITPRPGWVEQNPEDIWSDTLWAVQSLARDYAEEFSQLAGIGIANQRETTILWDRADGRPVYNAIVWQDRRTADICRVLVEGGHENMVAEKTGLLIDPYFSATKIGWILDNVPGAREKAERGELAFGTIDSFLLWRLTNGAVHATDATNASRTMLYNIRAHRWDDELLALFKIPRAVLPEVRDNVSDFGVVSASLLGKCHRIGGMAGDQQAALIGQACFDVGMVKSTYGTGCFALMNIGLEFRPSRNRLLTTIGYRIGGKVTYALEGSIFVAGAAIQWLRDSAKIIERAADSEALATSIDDCEGVYFIPAFTGLGAPHWRPDARAAIFGLTRGSGRAHIVRAALEAQGYQTRDLMAAFIADGGHDPKIIRADGGLVANRFMAQFLADMLDRPVEIPQTAETTAFGAACLAGLEAGIYGGLDEISAIWSRDRRHDPSMTPERREALYAGWTECTRKLLI